MDELQVGLNPRFIRLAWHLSKRFPGDEGLPKDATDEEIEVYHDREDPIWISRTTPLNDMLRHDTALWQPEVEMGHMADFMAALTPLARQLGLDIYDRMQGYYLPAYGLPVPRDEAMYFRLSFDPEIAKPGLYGYPNDKELREALLAKFIQHLSGHGFTPGEGFSYPMFPIKRPVPGGLQVIQPIVPAYSCNPMLIAKSARYAALRQALEPNKPSVSPAEVFSFSFIAVRELVQPAWQGLDPARTRNMEEVDWLLSELIQHGLPILEKARTIKGMDWLYNNPEAAKLFPHNRLHRRDSHNQALAAVAYAYWAGNPEFDAIVAERLDNIPSDEAEGRALIKACADYLRAKEQPMGDGIA